MNDLSCQRSRGLLSARAAGDLSAAEQILLSDHLDSCAACAAWARRHKRVVSLLKARQEGLPPERLEQLAARFQDAEPPPAVFWTKPRLRLSLSLSFAAALAALAALLLPRLFQGPRLSLTLIEGQVTLKAQGARLSAGSLLHEGMLLETGSTQATLMSANQKIILAPNTTSALELRGEERWLRLSSGEVFIEGGGAGELSVEAGALTARPVGTRFMVAQRGGRASVAVLEGRVDVNLAGALHHLNEGQEYLQGGQVAPMSQETRSVMKAVFGVVDAPASAPSDTLTASAPQREPTPEPPKSAPVKAPDAAKEIKEIEALLQKKELASARRRAHAALNTEPAPKDAARLQTLIAESYMAERDYAAAHQAYLVVFRTYPRTRDAGEALLTAGILELEQLKEAEQAQTSFETYLSRYPKGSLRESAHFYLCQALLRQGKKSEASRAASDYLQEFPAGEFASSLAPLMGGQ